MIVTKETKECGSKPTPPPVCLSRIRHDLVTIREAFNTSFPLLLGGSQHRERAELLVKIALGRLDQIIESMKSADAGGSGGVQ